MRTAFLFLACASLVCAQKKPITLENMDEAARLVPQGPGNPVAWAPDGKHFLYRQGRRLVIYDPASGSSKDLIDTSEMDSAAVPPARTPSQPFEWENRRVRETPVQWAGNQVLYSSGGDVFVIQIDTGKWTQLTKTPVAEHDPKLSPDGKSVAFRREWDLYALDIASKRETRLTNGGSDTLRGTLRNGGLDWVYPEELDLGTAYWWSPDSRSIVYLQFDISHEPIYPHEDLRGPRPIYEPQRYPQAGENNPDVRVGVVSARGGSTRWMDVGDTRDKFLIARVGWTPDSRNVYIVRTNRVQNKLELALSRGRIGKSVEDFGGDRQVLGQCAGGSCVRERRTTIPVAERARWFPAHIPRFHRRQTSAAIDSRLLGGDRDRRCRRSGRARLLSRRVRPVRWNGSFTA